MPPGNAQYTLVGFSPELDWRPLSFVKPIPPNRLCSACGLVRKRTATLPCMHVLCEVCYQQCAQEGLHVCPLDGYECQDEEDVDWKDIPADHLLRRQVRCWNEGLGCTSVMAASEISRHFQRDCGHHSVSCPKCSAGVLCGDVCSHLRSGCDRQLTPLGSEAEVPSEYKDDSAFFALFRAALENQAAESRRLFERLSSDTAAHGDRLNEVSHAINTLRETLKQELDAQARQNNDVLTKSVDGITVSTEEVKSCLATLRYAIIDLPGSIQSVEKTLKDDLVKGAKATRDHLSQVATSIKAEVKENTETTVDKLRQFIRHLQVAATVFIVKGVEELKQEALMKGWATYQSKKLYLRGYCISPGVYLDKEGECVKFCARMLLHKGDMDDLLQWPFQHKVNLCVLNPKDGSQREHAEVGSPFLKSLQKPTETNNAALCFGVNPLTLDNLVIAGFVQNNQLRHISGVTTISQVSKSRNVAALAYQLLSFATHHKVVTSTRGPGGPTAMVAKQKARMY